ncbi:SPOR domain-containing protein [Sandaracinobacteroides sp. A072]|uniref:SPOR domain-containing protein n=1 Tax=Sandaracinobacteroides sp. A072 TaxID=3461146 RepID=UPI00404119F5
MARRPSPHAESERRGRARLPAEEPDAPWLDEADMDDGPTHTLMSRRTFWGLVAALLLLTAGVVAGIFLLSGREDSPIDVPRPGEEIPVLASPGPWKEPPSGPDVEGIPVEGQGQVLFGTGDGRTTEARIALDAMPEDPLPRPGTVAEEVIIEPQPEDARTSSPAPGAVAPAASSAQPQQQPGAAAPRPEAQKPPAQTAPAPGPKTILPKPVETIVPKPAPQPRPAVAQPAPQRPSAPANGQMLQLGAFSSESRARSAFKALGERFRYLQGMEPLIIPVVADGKTLYRLRTNAGSPAAAREICGRLKVAGEACAIVE